MSTIYSVLIVACSLSTLVMSGVNGMDKDNHWPTHQVDHKTPRPTKYAPPSYDSDWHKPSYPKPTWHKTHKPTWEKTSKPTKHSPPKQAWKKPSHPKPTWQKTQKYDHETVEKEAAGHYYNPYDDRRRGIVTAQLEERIESDMQELAALDALEL